jgi:hypothetical protein
MGKSEAEVLLPVVDNDNDMSLPELQPQPMQMLNDSPNEFAGGFGAPAELYGPKKVRKALQAAGHLVPEEKDLADALLEIVQEHGKFNDDNTGVWVGYTPASDNKDNAEIGVKCGNCVFFNSPNGCSIIESAVEDGGLCRLAVLPDGAVTPRGITADADYGGKCPPATQDIVLNIENRQKAIDNVGYGPLNPAEPNEEFWQDKADRWDIDPVEAKKSICGNCVFFDRRPKTLDCIETGLAEGGSGEQSAWDSIDQAELGYCTALDFKCAASRTCNAWAAGGPITEDVKKEEPVTATAGSKPAPKKDQIKGSDKNKKGSAATGRKITFSKAVETSLKEKVETHNKSVSADSKKVTLSMLKAVYRRGAGAFSSSHRPDQNRSSWAMARVNAYLRLVKSGKPDNAKYTTDNDLLPDGHPKSTNSSKSLTASVFADRELYVELSDESLYSSPEEALVAMAEYSGLGYESIPVFRAAWRRGVANNESPFDRAARLAVDLYDSEDSDLLPKQEKKDW